MKRERAVALVRRDDVPSMRTIVVDGVEHWLGHVKDFTRNAALADFLPKDNRVSMAWVRLEAGERLDEHVHPVDSMILMCDGGTKTLGDVSDVMNAGDVLLVPQGRPHGFIGLPPDGFWGLSLQFDSRGLYEDIQDPWATFGARDSGVPAGEGGIADQLLSRNLEYAERFDKHRLFAMVHNGLLSKPEARSRFLDCFQIWSNHFQKMVLARVMTLQHAAFEELAWLHLIEELGHNRELATSRASLRPVFDPVLEASCAWFPWKTALISDAAKVVLIHLVVEASAISFYKHIRPFMAGDETGRHFDAHSVADDGHAEMGYAFLRKLALQDGQSLFDIQRQGWAMLMTVMGRIADLVVHHPGTGPVRVDQEHRDADDLVEV